MTAPPSNRDQSRAHERANIGRRCVSYFTLRTIIIFMETINDLYQTPAPLASRKALQRFCLSPGSSHLKHGTANLRPPHGLGPTTYSGPIPQIPISLGTPTGFLPPIEDTAATPTAHPRFGGGAWGVYRTQLIEKKKENQKRFLK